MKRIEPEIAVQIADHASDLIDLPRSGSTAGNSNKRIALALTISEETVKTHDVIVLPFMEITFQGAPANQTATAGRQLPRRYHEPKRSR